ARKEATLARNEAKLLREQSARAPEAALYWDHLARDDAEFAAQISSGMVAEGTHTPVDRSISLDGFPLARYPARDGMLVSGNTLYAQMSSRPNMWRADLQQQYLEGRKADPRLSGHLVLDMIDINTPASQSRRGEGADVKTYSEWLKAHPEWVKAHPHEPDA